MMNRTQLIRSNEKQQKPTRPHSDATSRSALITAAIVALSAVWLGSSAYAFNVWPSEANLAAACERNHLKHAHSNYCVDERHIVHVLAPDGTTSKPGFDWNVNNAAVVRAEAAVRYAHRPDLSEH